MTAEARPTPQTLKFALGEVELFSCRFNAVEQAGAEFVAPVLPPDADAVVVRDLPVVSHLKRLAIRRQIRYVPVIYRRYYVDLRGSFADYLKGLSHNSRKNLLRHVRRFEEAGGGQIIWREYRHPDGIAKFYELARSISRTTYQESLHEGFPATDAFRMELMRKAQTDRVRGYVLFLQGEPIAFRFCRCGTDILGENTGYNPAFRQWSPGTVLLYVILQSLFQEGRFLRYDFGESEQSYKSSYSNASALCARVYFFRLTFRHLVVTSSHLVCNSVSTMLGKLLATFGLKQAIKKRIRGLWR